MRLLRLEGDKFSLVEHVRDIPPYAILSHTWGEDHEEVTFRDLTDNTGQIKAGYSKLRFCANQAANDKLDFFWIDTCCIDKSSSAELSEAINSMFQWYRNAAKCYAYLSDVSTAGASHRKREIHESRWFTRGWTLQELIAPASVEFFSIEGHRLGDKNSLQKTLHDLTGIAILALQGSPLSQFSVSERMSWAAKRETKREEDAAYSLLGIFDIHMPLIYGEGRTKASNRLLREIKLASGDTGSTISPISTVPFRRDPDFVDRGALLNEVWTKCSMPASCVALVGLGGIGKSQISIEVTYRVREKSPNTWVFWVHASTQARFEEGYRRIAEATKIKGWDDPKVDILRPVYSWLSDERNGKWMIIVDNADDASVFSQTKTQIRGTDTQAQSPEPLSSFLPQSPNGSVLVTSRSRDVAYSLTGSYASIIEVKAMDDNDALVLLQKKLSSTVSKDNALELLRILDNMPLAVTQAAAFIEQRAPRMTISRYLDEIRRSDLDRTRLLTKDVGDNRRDNSTSNSIIATCHISFEHVQRQMPTAARLLSLMSLFDRQGIPESLLRGRYRKDSDRDVEAYFDEDIQTLTNFSLISTSADGREFEMHRLVQFSMRKWLEINEELEMWKEIFVTVMAENFPAAHYKNWTRCQALLPHAEAAAEIQPKSAEALKIWASFLFKTAWYLSEIGQCNKAHEMNCTVHFVRETLLGPDHPQTLDSLSSLGMDFDWKGQSLEAAKMHKRVYETRKRILGPRHKATLDSMDSLSISYRHQKRWKEAEELCLRVIETREIMFGDEHPSTLRSMANLALTYTEVGRWKEAEELEVRVTKIKRRVHGDKHPSTLRTMSNLVLVYINRRRWKEAEELGKQVIASRANVLGDEHPSTLCSMSNLVLAYMNQRRWKEAEELGKQVSETKTRVLGDEHMSTLNSMSNLVLAYMNQGRWKEAEDLGVRVTEMKKKVLGDKHPSTLHTMSNLFLTYMNQGRWKEAEELGERVTETKRRVFGEKHPSTLRSMSNLVFTHKNQHCYKKSGELELQAAVSNKSVIKDDHPGKLGSVANLASTTKFECDGTRPMALNTIQGWLEEVDT